MERHGPIPVRGRVCRDHPRRRAAVRSNALVRGSMLIRHRVRAVDLVAACRAFVSVSERGSFTVGAAAARMSQSVASRRIAALEERFGERLFERTSRRAVLTPFGRDMLPVVRQLVQAAEVLLHEAEAAKAKPWRLAVPGICSTAALALLVAEARGRGVTLDLRVAAPAQRRELVHAQKVAATARRPAARLPARTGFPHGRRAGHRPGRPAARRLPRQGPARAGDGGAHPARRTRRGDDARRTARRITTPGPTGLSRFRHPARLAVDDLLYLSTCVSDGTAADALFGSRRPPRWPPSSTTSASTASPSGTAWAN